MQWLVNVADEVKQPSKSNGALVWIFGFSNDVLVPGKSSEDIYVLGRMSLDDFTVRSEGPVDVVPLTTILCFILGPDVVCPTCGEHEEHFTALGLGERF